MIPPFATERLSIRKLQLEDAPELSSVSTPDVAYWLAFMDGGLSLDAAQSLIAGQGQARDYYHGIYFYSIGRWKGPSSEPFAMWTA